MQLKNQWSFYHFGPVVIIDTPGFDDEGELGEKRVEAARKILRNCDIAILVTVAGKPFQLLEEQLISVFKERKIPYLIVKNKADRLENKLDDQDGIIHTSTINKIGIEKVKEEIGKLIQDKKDQIHFVGDFVKPKDIVVLVTPIDESAPKGRMILPQQMAIREILDFGGVAVVAKETELEQILASLSNKPSMVITDSQVFKMVDSIVPKEIPLTSFSILMARYKGFLNIAVEGAKTISKLEEGARILISEGCTHYRQCEDIGTVKLPKWIQNFTGKNFVFEWSS